MRRILVIDTIGDSREALEEELNCAGWDVVVASSVADVQSAAVDAIVLVTDSAGLNRTLEQVEAVRESKGTPILLVTDLDRSGWDRTFGSSEGLDVDALFDKPADIPALIARLDGILKARRASAQTAAAPADMNAILDRAIAAEEEAAEFYRMAAASVTHAESREALQSLMREEGEHKRLLEEFRSGARPLPEVDGSDGSILEAFGAPDYSPDMSPADAFLLAANKEKLAIEVYENWAKLYPPGAEHDLLLRMAEVERQHKVKVEAMFTNAAFPEVW